MQIHQGGEKASCYAAADIKPTSEWNSHLAIHADQFKRRDIDYLAIVHAQPNYLTFLSHHPAYSTTQQLNNRLMRWQPETIMTFPEGISLLPFHVPGSAKQMEETVISLRERHLVIWQKHGLVARSDTSASKAADLVEYIEMAAKYEVLNLGTGSPSSGLTDDELRQICIEFNVPIPEFLTR
jgi:rhamnulose-1-phosphate aldolase